MRVLTIYFWGVVGVLGTGVIGAAKLSAEENKEIFPKKVNFEKLEKQIGGGKIFKKDFKIKEGERAKEGVLPERGGRQNNFGFGFPIYYGVNGYYPGATDVGFGIPMYYGFNGYYPSAGGAASSGAIKSGSSYPWWHVDSAYNIRGKIKGEELRAIPTAPPIGPEGEGKRKSYPEGYIYKPYGCAGGYPY